MNARALLLLTTLATQLACCTHQRSAPTSASLPPVATATEGGGASGDRVIKSEEEWRRILTPEEFHVMREKGTEAAFTGKYYASHEPARYVCAACGAELFSSQQKFDSGTGWPSFWAPVDGGRVASETDRSWGMSRTEVHCSRCGAHLGHVFDDGPPPTGLRYCINSVSIKAEPLK
jgi:peptide-methionine (R)-S-oxide reductase